MVISRLVAPRMPSPDHPSAVRVELGDRSYSVLIAPRLLDTLGERIATLFGQGRRAFLVYDAGLPDALVIAASRSLAHHGFTVSSASVQADETQKSLGAAARLLTDLARSRHERGEPVIALGGGITGDIAGFVASTYRRGVPVVQCPTTLLSMVDASVGGKTGVNLALETGLKKNMVGAFWQPSLVLADVAALSSLPDRHLRAGLAECLKHGLIGAMWSDASLFEWTVAALPRILARDEATLVEFISRNIALKARVVEADEREESPRRGSPAGGRMLLNLGHTFAHVLEALPGATPADPPHAAPLHHGEAVALGLLAAAAAGDALGITDPSVRPSITRALAQAGLPSLASGLPSSADLAEAMGDDKKASGGSIRIIVPTRLGHATVVTAPPGAALIVGYDAIRAR